MELTINIFVVFIMFICITPLKKICKKYWGRNKHFHFFKYYCFFKELKIYLDYFDENIFDFSLACISYIQGLS